MACDRPDMSNVAGSPSHLAFRTFFGIIFCLLALHVQAQSGVATVAAETSVYEDQPNDNGGSYSLYCIGNHATNATRRGYARFSLPAIPAGAVITRVVYNFTQNRVRTMGGGPRTANIEIRRVTESWVEGTGVQGGGPCGGGSVVAGVTWNSRPGVSAALSATEFLPATNLTEISIDTDIGDDDDGLIADVQTWADNPGLNFGWAFRVTEEDVADNARRMQPGSITIHWTEQNGGVMINKDGTFDPGGNGITDPGDLINYTFTVTNTGDVDITEVSVTDPLVSPINCPGGNPIPSLAPAAMEVCTGSYAITQNDIDNGVVNNTADADGACVAGNCPVNDDDTHMETIPPPPLEFEDGFEDLP